MTCHSCSNGRTGTDLMIMIVVLLTGLAGYHPITLKNLDHDGGWWRWLLTSSFPRLGYADYFILCSQFFSSKMHKDEWNWWITYGNGNSRLFYLVCVVLNFSNKGRYKVETCLVFSSFMSTDVLLFSGNNMQPFFGTKLNPVGLVKFFIDKNDLREEVEVNAWRKTCSFFNQSKKLNNLTYTKTVKLLFISCWLIADVFSFPLLPFTYWSNLVAFNEAAYPFRSENSAHIELWALC